MRLGLALSRRRRRDAQSPAVGVSSGYVGKAKARHATHCVLVVIEEGGRGKAALALPLSFAGRSLADEAADEEEALDDEEALEDEDEDEDDDEASE